MAALLLAGACSAQEGRTDAGSKRVAVSATDGGSDASARPSPSSGATKRSRIATRLRSIPQRVYVPNTISGTVTVIDPKTYRVIRTFDVGAVPNHVTPARNLKRLFVDNTGGNSLTVVNPRSAKPVRTIPVPDPYNLYYTPDGTKAIVVAERLRRLDVRDPKTMKLIRSVPIPTAGPDHLDFSSNGRYFLIGTEFSGMVYRVRLRGMKIIDSLRVGGLPIDVRTSPDGSVVYVANQGRSGVSIIDPRTMKEVRFLPTGTGAHGLLISRDAKTMFVSNRLAGSISTIDLSTRRVTATWRVGGTPDMMQQSPNGDRLWVSNRYSGTVSVVNTSTGRLMRTIAVGQGPHGLTYFPSPGHYSVGHNGVYR